MVGTRIELLTYWDPQGLWCVFAKRAMYQRSFPVSDHPPIRIGSATGARVREHARVKLRTDLDKTAVHQIE